MEIGSKGWSAIICIVIVLAVLKFFNAGVMHDYPTPEQVKEKAGQQIIDLIYAEAVLAQSEWFEQAEKNGADRQAAIRQMQEELQALKNINIDIADVQSYRGHYRRNMLKRDTEFLIKVEYTIGDSDSIQEIFLDLGTYNDSLWHVSKSLYSF